MRCIACSARGVVVCSTCQASGEVGCGCCHARGELFDRARLRCTVDSSFALRATTPLSEAQARLQALPSVAALAALAPVMRTHGSVEGNTVVNTYSATVQVTQLQLVAAQHRFEILGYGNSARVENFKNIIGIILEGDLTELEQALEKAPSIALWPDAELYSALSKVLESEIHSRIGAEGLRSAEGLKALAPGGLAYAVSEEYATRASPAIRDAVGRLYRGLGLTGTVLALGTTVVLAIVIDFLGLNGYPRLLAYTGSFAAALLAGWAYERWALAQLCTSFATQLERFVTLLRVSRSVRTWREIGFGLTLLATVLAVFGTEGIRLYARQRGYDEAKAALQRESEQRIEGAKNAVIAAKPAARHYLFTCLQDSRTRTQVAGFLPRAYGSVVMEPVPTIMKLFQELKQSPSEVAQYAQDGGMQWAMIQACRLGNLPAGAFDHDAWARIFRPLYYEGSDSYRTSYLNLLNADGELGGGGAAEAHLLAELIPLLLLRSGSTSPK